MVLIKQGRLSSLDILLVFMFLNSDGSMLLMKESSFEGYLTKYIELFMISFYYFYTSTLFISLELVSQCFIDDPPDLFI
jgi:hypothetical protein